MKKLVATLMIVFTSQITAQISWSPYSLIEESIHLGDVRPSYNYSNLNVLAANAGIRVGAFLSSPTAFSGEMTLGVNGLGSPGSFATNLIPVELVGHLNTLQQSKTNIRFNLDCGLGFGLAENNTSYYDLNRNTILGLSLEFPGTSKFESLIFGIRYVSNSVDFLDNSISGSNNDATLRFYSALRFDGRSKAHSKNEDDFNLLIVENIQFQKTLKEKEIEIALLQDVIEHYSRSEQEDTIMPNNSVENGVDLIPEEKTSNLVDGKNIDEFAIIIASFKNLEVATNFLEEYNENCEIIFDQQNGNYRIAFKIVDSIEEATEVSRNLKERNEDNWILRL